MRAGATTQRAHAVCGGGALGVIGAHTPMAGALTKLTMLDMYNNSMTGDVPASIQNLTSLQYLYLDDRHYKPLRQYYCRQRLPQNGKYSYRIVRENYLQMSAAVCEDMHGTEYTFNPLQVSGAYDA